MYLFLNIVIAFSENACGMDFSADTIAPPLPPRTLHRPLERSHALNSSFTPPAVHRQNKPKKIQRLEDSFGFELIDTDEEYKSYGTASTTSSLSDADVTSTPIHKVKNLVGCDNYITTVLSKSKHLESSHMLVEKNDGPNSFDVIDGPAATVDELLSNPHKPLSRQRPEIETALEDLQHVLQPKPREIIKPHPKALHRVAALSDSLVSIPVCPPTPTHHSKKPRTPELRPPNLKNTDPPDFQLNGHEVLSAPSLRHSGRSDNLEGCCGISTSRIEDGEHLRISLIAMSELRNLSKEHSRYINFKSDYKYV